MIVRSTLTPKKSHSDPSHCFTDIWFGSIVELVFNNSVEVRVVTRLPNLIHNRSMKLIYFSILGKAMDSSESVADFLFISITKSTMKHGHATVSWTP